MIEDYTIGLDFGTHQSKVCYEDASDPRNRMYTFIEFSPPKGKKTFFLPSVVQINKDNTLSYGFVNEKDALVSGHKHSFEEPVYEEPQRMAEAAEEPELTVSRETIAQFDEYVKSFEREAGIISEPEFEEPAVEEPVVEEPVFEEPVVEETVFEAPVVEEPVVEEPKYEAPKFELPDFLKKVTSFASRREAPVAAAPVVEEPEPEVPEEEPLVDESVLEVPDVEAPAFDEPFEPEVTPDIDELFAGLTPASQAAPAEPVAEEPVVEEPVFEAPVVEEPAVEEPVFEAPVAEEPAVEEPVFEAPAVEEPAVEEPVFEEPKYEDAGESMEDLYLDFESAAPSGRTVRFDASLYDEIDDDDDEDDEDDEEKPAEGDSEEHAPSEEAVVEEADDDEASKEKDMQVR